ncbi:MAG: tetratricopeptide repeat protein, partial [Caulobacteraceae bacterium]
MRLSLLLTAAAPLVLLCACATAPGAQSASGPGMGSDVASNASPYGKFLAGQQALNNGRSAEAAKLFDQARAASGDPMIAEQAFRAALLAGDIQKASTLAPTGAEATEASKRLGKLVAGVEALADGKGKEAFALLNDPGIGFPHKPAAVLLAPWAAAQAGDVEGSLVRPQVRGDRLVDYFGQIGQATLFERAKRYDEAETDYKAAVSPDQPTEMAVRAYGAFLERRGRRVDALALYGDHLAREPDSIAVK